MSATRGGEAAEHQRLRERREAVAARGAARRRRLRQAALVTVALVALALGLGLSPLLEAREVAVRGVDDAQRVAAVEERTARALGAPLALADTAAAAEAVQRLPWVREAVVTRELPGTLAVAVEPREPLLVLETEAGAWLVDAEAVVLGGGAQEGLPVVRAPQARAQAGERLASDGLREAVAVVDALATEVHARLDRLEVGEGDDLVLHLDVGAGATARLGDRERLADKVEALELLVADLQGRQAGEDGELEAVSEIDVRNPDRPVVRREGE